MNKSIHDPTLQAHWINQFQSGDSVPVYLKHVPNWGVWHNQLNPNSLRLSRSGYKWAVEICKQTAYKFNLPRPITNGVLLKLERQLTAPYFLETRSKLSVFSEQDALMLELNGQNLEQYLADLAG